MRTISAAAERGEPPRPARPRSPRADLRRLLEQDGAGVEPLVHPHRRHPGPRVAGGDGGLDRRGAAPARQQRGVEVDAAVARQVEQRAREDLAEGDDHGDVGRRAPPPRPGTRERGRARAASPRRPCSRAQRATGGSCGSLAAAGRARRLGDDAHRRPPRRDQGGERRHREFRRAEEEDAVDPRHAAKDSTGEKTWPGQHDGARRPSGKGRPREGAA